MRSRVSGKNRARLVLNRLIFMKKSQFSRIFWQKYYKIIASPGLTTPLPPTRLGSEKEAIFHHEQKQFNSKGAHPCIT